MRRNRPEIAIVGGGPAGLSAALTAASHHCRCVLYERGRIGEGIRCAEGLFDPTGIVPMEPEFICTRVKRALVRVGGGEFNYKFGNGGHFYILDRKRWQESLGDRVRAAGVEIRESTAADPAQLVQHYDAVIDARGAVVFSSRWKRSGHSPGFGLQWVLEGDFSRWQDAMEVEIYDDIPGYFWIFPKGTSLANVGFGWLSMQDRTPNHWQVLEQYLRRRGLTGCRKLRRVGGFLPGHCSVVPLEGNIYRVGDAGGFASPLHGGGIDAAWLSGQAAVEAIVQGKPGYFQRSINDKLGFIRQLEMYVVKRWQAEGPVVLHRAAQLLASAGPVLRASPRFLSSPFLRAVVLRALGKMPSNCFYRFELQDGPPMEIF